MGSTNDNNQQFSPSFLDQNQQDLLMAALASNQQDRNGQFFAGQDMVPNGNQFDYSMGTMDPAMFLAAQPDASLANFDMSGLSDQQLMELMENNGGSIDFDSYDAGRQSFDDTADPSQLELDLDGDGAEKRKNPEEDKDDTDPKRREGDDKTAKKPGRKPLTTEPTTKRKAQNRAAQRAFRERKEKHLKDLETKVEELEKASDSTNHENALLRAQVQRLQMELREYRKRLSLNSTLGRSPPLNGTLQSYLTNTNGNNSGAFNFEFPKFGSLPNGPFTANAGSVSSATNGTSTSRHTSTDGRASPKSQARSSMSPGKPSSGSDSQNGSSPAFTNENLFGTPLSNASMEKPGFNIFSSTTDNQTTQSASDSSASNPRIFQFNSRSNSSASPSASSVSQYVKTPSSSCGTSPEASHNSPATGNKDSNLDTIEENGFVCHTTNDGEISFCEKLNMACGNIRDPTPRAKSMSNVSPASLANPAPGDEKSKPEGSGVGGIDYFATQNGGQFDPVLFGEYRDTNTAIIGDGDFTGGFFNDAMPTPSMDWSAQFNWNDLTGSSNLRTGLTPGVQKDDPMDATDTLLSPLDDDELVVPGEDTTQMLSCHKIWDKLQQRPDFKEGNLDIDGLCNELRAKARCSETGVVIDQKDVDAALKRLPASRSNSASTPTGKA
jgi:AP-1-like factor